MLEQSERDLNHPYAYQYDIATGQSGSVFADLEASTSEAPKSRTSPYVSTLVSAVVHAGLLVVAGLFVLVLPKPTVIELEITKAPVASDQPVEMFVMDEEVDAPQTDETEAAIQPAEIQIQLEKVTLDADLAFAETTQTEAVSTSDTSATATEVEGQGSKFFGMAAYGDHFVYVLDISGSMARQSQIGNYSEETFGGEAPMMVAQVRGRRPSRFDIARNELMRSIENLNEEQSFCVILFNARDEVMFGWNAARLMVATNKNKRRLGDWLTGVRPKGGTNPADALREGFDVQPDAIFLLSDGEFNHPGAADRVLHQNVDRKIPLHTVAFESASSRRRLRRYSEATDGRHRYVGSQSKAELLLFDLNSQSADSRDAMQNILDEKIPLSDLEKARVGLSCCRHLISSRADVARLAHECLVSLSDGSEDFGPQHRGKRRVVMRSSRLWTEYWSSRLRAAES